MQLERFRHDINQIQQKLNKRNRMNSQVSSNSHWQSVKEDGSSINELEQDCIQKSAIMENLNQNQQNRELQNYITQKLDQLMIEYNQGFIYNLSLEGKLKMKQQIDTILTRGVTIEMNKKFYERNIKMQD